MVDIVLDQAAAVRTLNREAEFDGRERRIEQCEKDKGQERFHTRQCLMILPVSQAGHIPLSTLKPGAAAACFGTMSQPTSAPPLPPDGDLRIAIVDENPLRAAILEEGLREAGHSIIHVVREMDQLLYRLSLIAPDVVLMDFENPSRDVLEQMFQVSKLVERPVAMFVDRSDQETMAAAIEAGVSAYIVDGLRKERVKAILDMSVLRFNAFARLKRELDQTRSQLEDRKIIDRAKGFLMASRGMSEAEAYDAMRRTAMNEKTRIGDIARSIVTASQLLGGIK
jgi:two-component system, response regulator / RNA-binding antiterminator